MKIGLALSGGGARGFAHIGVLKVFDEIGLEVDYIAGTSMGAIIGGLYSTGLTASEIEEIIRESIQIERVASDLVQRKDYYIGEKRWGNYANFSFPIDEQTRLIQPLGLISGNKITYDLFKATYPYSSIENFDELPIPFAAVAANLETGEMKVIRSGSLAEAIRASMSAPSIYTPFSYECEILIDGGIKMNLPAPVVIDMGANYTIGVQVNSELKDRKRLTNIPSILEQTINISSQDSRLSAIETCSLLIEPSLDEYSSYDFNKISKFIESGEKAAREKLPELIALKEKRGVKQKNPSVERLEELITINNINVIGNKWLSSTKVREYLKIDISQPLSMDNILEGIHNANNSLLFQEIYPVIKKKDEGYELQIKVRERLRKNLSFSLRYTENNDMILSSILQMRNTLGNNSTFLSGIKIGGEKEVFIDYAKNFGREWGVYFRIFPYANEHTIFFYNNESEKIASSNALEMGATLGVGGFGFNRYIIETYLYSYKKRLYRNISESDIERNFFSSGVGIKFYNETLDDLMFPISGSQTIIKLTHSDENMLSDHSYTKVYGRLQFLTPVTTRLSLKTQLEYGSYFDENAGDFDPFYVGGFDSFLGMRSYERSASIVKVGTLAARIQPINNLFVDIQANGAIIGGLDYWDIDESALYGAGLKVGYSIYFGAIRGGIGIDKSKNIRTYLSIGYDFDAFEFSRK
jgi:NTE family protein